MVKVERMIGILWSHSHFALNIFIHGSIPVITSIGKGVDLVNELKECVAGSMKFWDWMKIYFSVELFSGLKIYL